MNDFTAKRRHMVDGQVRINDVTDLHLIDALLDIPREEFMPKAKRARAYAEMNVEIGQGRYLLRPRDFTKLLKALEPKKTDIAMTIAAGRGYASAVLARLVETVVGVEPNAKMRDKAGLSLTAIGADNAVMIEGDLRHGAPDEGPFDVILVEGAVTETPKAWLDQLSDGGRLGVFEHKPGQAGRAVLYRRDGGAIGRRELFDADAPLLPGFETAPAFVF